MHLSKPENHIAMALAALISTVIIGGGLWIGLSNLFGTEPESLKWYASLIGAGLAFILLLCGITGFVLNIMAFAKVRPSKEKGQHSPYRP